MSELVLLFVVTGLVVLFGTSLTSSWHNYLVARRNRKLAKRAKHNQTPV